MRDGLVLQAQALRQNAAGQYTKVCHASRSVFSTRVRQQMQRVLLVVYIPCRTGRLLERLCHRWQAKHSRTRQHELKYGLVTKGTAKGAGAPQCHCGGRSRGHGQERAVGIGNATWAGKRRTRLGAGIMERLPEFSLSVLDVCGIFLGYEWTEGRPTPEPIFSRARRRECAAR